MITSAHPGTFEQAPKQAKCLRTRSNLGSCRHILTIRARDSSGKIPLKHLATYCACWKEASTPSWRGDAPELGPHLFCDCLPKFARILPDQHTHAAQLSAALRHSCKRTRWGKRRLPVKLCALQAQDLTFNITLNRTWIPSSVKLRT